jgi:2-aminoadipate transaminase
MTTRNHAAPIGRLAKRSVAFTTSVWETADKIFAAGAPDSIFFGNGVPAREAMPIERLEQAAHRTWNEARTNAAPLGYGEVLGYEPLRKYISARMAEAGSVVDPGHVLLTTGSQQGLDFICRLMLEPGDAVIIEGPTYVGALQVFDSWQARYIVAPMDEQGIDVDALRALLDKETVSPKLLYTIPTFQNPTGRTLTLERRQALLDLANEHGILVLEDDPYGDLWFEHPGPPALRSLDPGVVYFGSFSKTVAPGIRVGWTVAPPPFMPMLQLCKEVADINGERIGMRTLFNTVDGFLDGHLPGVRPIYRERCNAMLAGLEAHMPAGSSWSRPEGGFFVWVTLPEGFRAVDLLHFSAPRGVIYLAGEWFYPGYTNPHDTRSLRLNFSTQTPERIAEGTRRLGEAAHAFAAGR